MIFMHNDASNGVWCDNFCRWKKCEIAKPWFRKNEMRKNTCSRRAKFLDVFFVYNVHDADREIHVKC